MNETAPVAPPVANGNGRVLSGSVVAAGNAAGFGAAVATMVIVIYHMHGIDFPAGFEGALGGAITAATVYLRAILARFTGVNLP